MTQAPGLVECQPAIRMRNISKEFYGQRVLTGVDLDLQAGELHAILGENGAGKSTLCSISPGNTKPRVVRSAVQASPLRRGRLTTPSRLGSGWCTSTSGLSIK